MTDNWLAETYKRAEIERKEREDANRQQSKEFFDGLKNKAESERAEMEELQRKTAQKIHHDNSVKRDKELNEAKQKAMQQVQSEYESKHGVSSDKTDGINQAWSNLLKGL